MKRFFLLLSANFLWVFVALSQMEISKGTFVGFGLSAFKSGYGESFLPKINTGVFAKVLVFDELFVRPEIAYSQRGDFSSRETITIEYVDFSVLADYRYILHGSSGFSIHAMAGPMWSRMFQASHSYTNGPTTIVTDMNGQTSKLDFGFLFGGGLGIHVGNGSLFIDSRLFLGTYELTLPVFGTPMLNRSVSFVAGFEF